MANSIFTSGLAIHFVNDLSNDTHYIYDVELENVGVDGVNYNMGNLACTNGTNVMYKEEFDFDLQGKVLLNRGHIVVGVERVSGIVAFEKMFRIPNDPPIFEYEEITVTKYSAQVGGV